MKANLGDNTFRHNLRSFINEVNAPHPDTTESKAPEAQFDKLKELFGDKGLTIFILTKQTHRDLQQGGDKGKLNLVVRQLDPKKFKKEEDFNRLERLVIFNKNDNTFSLVTVGEQQPIAEDVNIVLKLKTSDKARAVLQVIGEHLHVKKLSQDDFNEMNQVIAILITNLQTPKPEETLSLLSEGGETFRTVTPMRTGRSKDAKSTSESSTTEQKDLPASERETFVEAAEKIQKELAVRAREGKALEESGKKRREKFLKEKNRVERQKEDDRYRIAKDAAASKEFKHRHR